MLIGIDGNEANVSNRVGSGQFAFELLRQFSQIKTNHKFVVYLKKKPLQDLPEETNNFSYRIFGPKKLWTQIALPFHLYLDKPKPDIFFTPSHYAPRFSPVPIVITIFDLSFVHYPKMFQKSDLYQLKNWTAYSVKKSAKILTISQISKADIIKYYKVSEAKVVVIYPGVSENFKPQPATKITQVKKKYKIKGDYVLYVGTLQPRKNLIRLIEAFSKLGADVILVIAGRKGWLYDEIFKKVKKLSLEDRVIFADFVADPDLPALFSGAKVYVNVSLWEGFGIPVVEAMACGTPVVVSNTSSLPEVVGDVGILVNPENVDDIASGITQVLNIPPPKYEALKKKSIQRVKKFSWKKCAKEVLAVITEVSPNQ